MNSSRKILIGGLSIVAALALLSTSFGGFYNQIQAVVAQQQGSTDENITNKATTTKVPPSEWTDEYIQSVLPSRISDAELEQVKQVALSDNRVRQIIANRPYEFLTTDYIGNIGEKPVRWVPEIYYNIANETQLAIIVDMSTRKVIEIQTVEVNPILDRNNDPEYDRIKGLAGLDPNSYAIQRITGTSSAPKSIEFRSQAITFTNQVGQTTGNVLMINAQRSGATAGNACDSTHTSDRYWAQLGFYWRTEGKINYDDTSTSCSPVFPIFTYTAGNNYKFSITGKTTGWELTAVNLGSGVAFTYTGPAINTDTFQTSDTRTSVFFENKQFTGTNWAPQFGSNPSGNTAKWSPDRVTFNNWPNNVRIDQTCTGAQNTYPYDSTKEVMAGELKSGGSATWSATRMQAYPAC